MLVEERRYTFYPGKLQTFLHLYEHEAMAVQRQYLPHLLGYFVSEVGALNQITALWGYPSLEQRALCRAALFADQRWIDFLEKARPLMTAQECRLLTPASFFRNTLSELMSGHKTPGENNEKS